MEITSASNDFKLWSPPLLDLSLDSFSNDLFQEFDKTRLSIQDGDESDIQTQDKVPPAPALSSKENSLKQQHQEQEQDEEEDGSSAANLFRKSSTFLKKKLSTNGSQRNSAISTATINNAEEISNIASRQYPPKPLQYSPIIEPPSDKNSRHSRDSANVLTITEEASEEENHHDAQPATDKQQEEERENEEKAVSPAPSSPSVIYTTASPPNVAITVTTSLESSTTADRTAPVSNATRAVVKPSTTTAANAAPTLVAPNTPKRRSFFSFRFC
ncbi:hypothetical protein BD408DRAFT_419047 [Parasitella parasitica]|nr:hypothetical protein BD408DRAFT_419047 [Parasitella parasitica]